jgi:hypothetical protein
MKGYPVREFQLRQRADLAIEVRIVPKESYSDEVGREILAVIAANVPGVSLSLHLVTDIPRTAAGKMHPVVSDVQTPSGSSYASA